MKLLPVAALAAVVIGAPLAADAQTFRLTMTRDNLLTTRGDRAVDIWANEVADQVCGRDDLPDPLELHIIRKQCRAEMIAKAKASRDQQAALVRQEIQNAAATPATGNVSAQPSDTTSPP